MMPNLTQSHYRLRPESRYKLDDAIANDTRPRDLREVITAADINPDWFWDNVDKSGFCWIWTGTKDQNGYGQVRIYIKRRVFYIPATHVGLYLTKGILIDRHPSNDIEACHLCDNPPCVQHIEARDHESNMRYRIKDNVRAEPLTKSEFELLVQYEAAWFDAADTSKRHLPHTIKARLYSISPKQYRMIRLQACRLYIRQHWGPLTEHAERSNYGHAQLTPEGTRSLC